MHQEAQIITKLIQSLRRAEPAVMLSFMPKETVLEGQQKLNIPSAKVKIIGSVRMDARLGPSDDHVVLDHNLPSPSHHHFYRW